MYSIFSSSSPDNLHSMAILALPYSVTNSSKLFEENQTCSFWAYVIDDVLGSVLFLVRFDYLNMCGQ
jgi:hypothetical protein